MNINEAELSITRVVGERGDVSNGGETEDHNLIVVGMAGSNASLTLYDKGEYLDFTQADEMGDWAKSLSSLSTGFHELTAKTSNGESTSNAWSFTIVSAAVRPDISHVQDLRGNLIENGGTTQDTIVILFGTAQDSIVEILDDTTSWGTAQVDGNNIWSKRLAGIEIGEHRFTARNTSDGLASLPWVLTVESANTAPVIVRVQDSNNQDITNGGSTEDTSIVLSGTAMASATIEVLDETTSWGTVPVSLSGRWSKPLAGLEFGLHRFRAKEVSSQLESLPWQLTVVNDPLVIDTSPMRLDGFSIYMGWPRTDNDSPGNTQVRRPTGGSGVYSYSSGNTAIARVDANGKVWGVGWGETTVSVSDEKSNVVTFPVFVTNVYELRHSSSQYTHAQAVRYFETLSSRYIAYEQRAQDEMVRLYQRPYVYLDQHYWCPVHEGCGGGLGLCFLYPEQSLGCADPNLIYDMLILAEIGTAVEPNVMRFRG